MFENIIGQDSVVTRLRTEVAGSLLPAALLFHGPDYSGKSSTSLELARVLMCTNAGETGRWNCPCRSCELHRHLLHPELLLLGPRYFLREIAIAADALKRDSREALRYLFARSVRKLTRRYDTVLWEGEEKRLSAVHTQLTALDEEIEPLLPGARDTSGNEKVELIDEVVTICGKIHSALSLESVPVNTIRNLNTWARLSPAGPAKVAVIENVDRLQDSSRNALLKTLEDAPSGVHFVLTTQRSGAVIATIRSRSRSYGFLPRDSQDSSAVIERIFRDKSGPGASIRDYFVSKDGHGLKPLAGRYIENVVAGTPFELGLLDELSQTIRNLGGAEGFRYFVEEISLHLETILRSRVRESTGVSPRLLASWRLLLGNALDRFESYNTSASMAVEGLFYGMREAQTGSHAEVH